MFKKKTGEPGSQKAPQRGSDPIGNSPLTAYERGKQEWFERMGSPIVERDRYFVLAGLIAICFAALVLTLMNMMPLTRVVPYTVQVEKFSGEVKVARTASQMYKPGNPEKQFFLTHWVRNLMTLDPHTSPRDFTEAYEMTRSKATDEFTDFMNKYKPLVRVKTELGLTRTVEIKSFSVINEQSVMIRFATEERAIDQKPIRKNHVITIHFAIEPPETESGIMKNPLGLYVTHFAINEDLS